MEGRQFSAEGTACAKTQRLKMAISLSKAESILMNLKSSIPVVAKKRDYLFWILLAFEATLPHTYWYCLVPVCVLPSSSLHFLRASRWGLQPSPVVKLCGQMAGVYMPCDCGHCLSVLLWEVGIPAVTSRVRDLTY